jgi:hypothetical protein
MIVATITDCMLTTFDNPFDPFEQFNLWFMFDIEKGYNSCGYLARIAKVSDSMSQIEEEIEIERAIDEIIQYDFLNIYKKAFPKSSTNEVENAESKPTEAETTNT